MLENMLGRERQNRDRSMKRKREKIMCVLVGWLVGIMAYESLQVNQCQILIIHTP